MCHASSTGSARGRGVGGRDRRTGRRRRGRGPSRALAMYGTWWAAHTRAAAQRRRCSGPSASSGPSFTCALHSDESRRTQNGRHLHEAARAAPHRPGGPRPGPGPPARPRRAPGQRPGPPRARPRSTRSASPWAMATAATRGQDGEGPVAALGSSKPSGSARTASGSGRSMLASHDRNSMPAPSPTAPRTRSVRASSDAPTASQAARSRATDSQLRGLGHPRLACSASCGDLEHQGRSHLEKRSRPLPERPGSGLSVGEWPSNDGRRTEAHGDSLGPPSWHPPASRGGPGDWPAGATAASRRPLPRAGWPQPPPGPLGQRKVADDPFEHDPEHRGLDGGWRRRQLVQEEEAVAGRGQPPGPQRRRHLHGTVDHDREAGEVGRLADRADHHLGRPAQSSPRGRGRPRSSPSPGSPRGAPGPRLGPRWRGPRRRSERPRSITSRTIVPESRLYGHGLANRAKRQHRGARVASGGRVAWGPRPFRERAVSAALGQWRREAPEVYFGPPGQESSPG